MFFGLILIILGGLFLYRQKQVQAPVVPAKPPEVLMPVPVREPTVEVPVPIVTNGYVIGVVSVSKSVNGEYLNLKVTNDGDTTLQLDPDSQFKLVGVTDQTTRVPIAGKTSVGFKTTLAPDAAVTGTIVFDVIPEQQSELRFYPDIAQPTYIVVPLIPLPEDQR